MQRKNRERQAPAPFARRKNLAALGPTATSRHDRRGREAVALYTILICPAYEIARAWLRSLSKEALTMPLMGPIAEGKTFFCPHCGALYAATASRVPKDSDIVKCVVCFQTMDAGDSAKLSIYKLVHRPEDA